MDMLHNTARQQYEKWENGQLTIVKHLENC